MADVVIKRLAPSDADVLGRFFIRNNRPQVTDQFHPFELTTERACLLLKQARRDRLYGLFHGESLVGFCILRGWDDGYEVPSLGIVVDYASQGRGIGGRLMRYVLEEAAADGIGSVRLSVYRSNERAYRLYQSLGFREIGSTPVVLAGREDEKVVLVRDHNAAKREREASSKVTDVSDV